MDILTYLCVNEALTIIATIYGDRHGSIDASRNGGVRQIVSNLTEIFLLVLNSLAQYVIANPIVNHLQNFIRFH